MTRLQAEPEPDDRPKAGPRFTYASGSQPLAGYTIKRGVGRGGFGEVYFALSDAGKEVALKLIRRNLDVELRGVTHCLNLKHPNLIAIYDIRTDENDDRWVVMEYVSGESLEDVIERHPNGMPADLAIQWFSGIAAGVAYLHDHGIVHRDLKPANIFLDEGTVKIGDYGLSKFISCSRRSGQTESVGTVHYMAPEIANGRYGREIDTYALGVILYEMLTGHVPFEGESVGEVLMKHLTAEPDLHALDEPYREIVRGAMAKDPETRIRNVADMLASMTGAPVATAPLLTVKPVSDGSVRVGTAARSGPWPGDGPRSQPNSSEEPILATIKRELSMAREDFRSSPVHPLVKSALGVGIAVALVATTTEWLPVAVVCGLIYLVYRAFWVIVIRPSRPGVGQFPQQPPLATASLASAPPQEPAAGPGPSGKKPTKRQLRLSRQKQLREFVASQSLHERSAKLVGGMLVAALVASVASLVICLIAATPFKSELFVWMTAVGTIGSWAVMVPACLAEGKVEDQAPLRFTLLIAGAAVGVLAWAIADWLILSPQLSWNSMGVEPRDSLMSQALGVGSNSAVAMPLQVFAAYFAFLFVIVAWWEQAECTRTSRVSLWTIVRCGFVAWLLHFIWWFPQPLGLLLAAIMSFTLQFASPWLTPSKRRQITEGV